MKHLEQLKLENECRKYWGAWLDTEVKARMVSERSKLWEIYLAGYIKGKDSMDNELIDKLSECSDDSIIRRAGWAWQKWADDNGITPTNTQPETYKLMSEAFIDGYLSGFTKRFTEGA